MRKRLILLLVLALAACGTKPPIESLVQTAIAETQAALPSSTLTRTPPPIETPTETPTLPPTSTPVPSETPTVAPSATPSPTAPPVASFTPTGTSTLTPELGCPQGCTAQQPGCDIKGNISTSGEKIYHVPGGEFYDRTVIDPAAGERWFCTEEEAVANGWRKSKR